MTLSRALSAEVLKLRRTIALKVVVLAPVAVVLLTLFMASQAPFTTLRPNTEVDQSRLLIRVNLQFWGPLMLPLYLTLQTALLAGIDHSENQWKALFARPVPRWTIYASKLLVVMTMAAASAIILAICIWVEAAFMKWYDPELHFAFPGPGGALVVQTANMTGLGFLALVIQNWVALRWRSFSIAIGVGAAAVVASFAMLLTAGPNGGWPQYFPWSLPSLVVARQPQNIMAALWLCGIVGIVAAVAGCIDVCRREVS
jgi:lantibiotic transport system permease protein